MGSRSSWRRGLCSSDPDSTHTNQTHSPSTPSLHHHSSKTNHIHSPTFQTKTNNLNPNSPISPKLNLSLFRSTFKFRNACGICLNSVKRGKGRAIYTAECGHAFHFLCLVSHPRNSACPICHATWNNLPLQQYDTVSTYHEDDPLAIPEPDENTDQEQNDDLPDFPAFFLHPNPHSSLPHSHAPHSRSVRVKLMPECAIISVSQSHQTRALLLRLKAPPPPLPRRRRPPMDLVTVLDVKNGMTRAKLHMLKRAMRLVISSLGTADRLAVVASSANPKRLLPLRTMTAQGQRAARRVLDRLVCGQGNSDGEEAMIKAAKVLEDRRERNPLAKILLLSDGNDNNSNKIQRRCLSHVSSIRFDCIQVKVHSFGFETGKTGLMHEQLEDAFVQYVTRTLSVAVQDLRIQLGFSAPAEIRAVYSCSGGPTALSATSATLGNLYAEEEKELLVEVRVPTSAMGTHHVMTVRCVNKDHASQEFVYGAEHALTVVPPNCAAIWGGRAERLRNVFITSRAVAESRRLSKHNEFSSAHHLLSSARALLAQFDSAHEYVRGLEAELVELRWRKQQWNEREVGPVVRSDEVLTPTSAWRAAEKLAKMARMKKSLNKVGDLHGFENARF